MNLGFPFEAGESSCCDRRLFPANEQTESTFIRDELGGGGQDVVEMLNGTQGNQIGGCGFRLGQSFGALW